MNYVQLAIPFFILAVALEALWGALSGKQTYRVNDTVNSLQMGVLSRLVSILKLGFSGLVFSWLTTTLGIPQLPVDAAWVWV
ncbi:MAG: hypothetical protein KDI36_17685, partial [Pseudomonadales bacterium]|nr:hypothetical protein [Pseudomonadales bacterium]